MSLVWQICKNHAMARMTFTTDSLLDSARDILLERGPRAATVSAIAAHAGAPTGSIYHRFESVDDMLARTWLRAVSGTHTIRPTPVPSDATALDVAVSMALASYDYCVSEPEDAVLLDKFRRDDILQLNLSAAVRAEIVASNVDTSTTMAELARSLFGHARRDDIERLVLALVDLPYSFAQRYLVAGKRPPPARRALLPAAVRAILAEE